MNCLNVSEKLVFIGGDLRQIRVINQIAKCGIGVSILGFDGESMKKIDDIAERLNSIDELKNNAYTAVLPLPYTIDGVNINAPFYSGKMPVSEIVKAVPKQTCILAGRCDERLRTMCEIYNIRLIDYFCREELMMLNAIPTAEGAIQIAMEELPHTVHSSECLVIGNGRIGKILAKMLCGIGAKVTVSARKRKDLAQISAFGYEGVPIWELHDYIGKFDIIFNTVPSMILDRDLLTKVHRHCLIIDLASKPGGVDFAAAHEAGIKTVHALSLPGKVAPDTAGDIIKNTILNILDEMKE